MNMVLTYLYLSMGVFPCPCLCWFAVSFPWFGLRPPLIYIYIYSTYKISEKDFSFARGTGRLLWEG